MNECQETVIQVCDEMLTYKTAMVDMWARRIKAAFDREMAREMAAKNKEINSLRRELSCVREVTGDCNKCEKEGDESCPWYGEPDGCNNREARKKFLRGELVNPVERKVKYEYAVKNIGGYVSHTLRFGTLEDAKMCRNNLFRDIVRRKVGEWEEVKDGE